MAEPVNLLGNNFQELTPEQLQMLQRDAIRPSMSPAELMAYPVGGGAAALLYALARGGGLPRLGALAGGLAGGAGVIDRGQKYGERILDAEGQPGGFYGNTPPNLLR